MKNYAIAVALIASCAAAPAFAETITFENATVAPDSSVTVGNYRFTYLFGQAPTLFTSDNGATGLGDDAAQRGAGSNVSLSRIDGSVFTIISGIYALRGRVAPTNDMRVNGVQVFVDGQTFAGPANITSYTFDSFAFPGAVGLRSLDVSAVAAAVVPEPATWAMMLVGFGMIGATTRYRRKGVQVRYA